MKRISLALALLFATSAYAQAPPPAPPTYALSGPTTITPNTLAVFRLTGGTQAKCAWLVQPNTSSDYAGDKLVFTGAPGVYQVICLAVADGEPVILQATCTIGIPTPPVPPTPPPPVSTGPYIAFAFFDSTAPANAIIGSTTVGASLQVKGYTWYPQDYNAKMPVGATSIPASSTSWGMAANKAGLPAVVVIDAQGNIVGTPATLPATEAALVSSLPTMQGRR